MREGNHDLGRLVDDDCPEGALAETRAVVADLVQQLTGHLAKEENLLFPLFFQLIPNASTFSHP